MDRSDRVAYDMLGVCQRLSPTGREQQSFSELYNTVKAEGAPNEIIVLHLMDALSDGIRFGNWPQPQARVKE